MPGSRRQVVYAIKIMNVKKRVLVHFAVVEYLALYNVTGKFQQGADDSTDQQSGDDGNRYR